MIKIIFKLGLLAIVAVGFFCILPKGSLYSLKPDQIRAKCDELVSETAKKVTEAERRVAEFRKKSSERKGGQTRFEFLLETTLEKIGQNDQAIQTEERRLRKIRELCESGSPIPHPIDSRRVLTDDEVGEQIEVAVVRLRALQNTAAALEGQKRFAEGKIREFRSDINRGPVQLVELESKLDSLKVQYALYRDQLRTIDQSGVAQDLSAMYAEANAAISNALSQFDSAATRFVQLDFPELETAADRSAKHISKIDAVLPVEKHGTAIAAH